jgi:hypothetical protein
MASRQMDFDDITLGEIAEIEDYAGLPFSDIAEEKVGVIKLRIALAWILKRRNNPDFTIADAENLTTSDMNTLFEGDDTTKK